MAAGVDAYLLCSTPRTGSTWLCGLLESTRVAGRPASYFRKADENTYADGWGVPRSSDGTPLYAEFVRAAKAAGTTDNGVFGARIMWGTMDEVVLRLRTIYPAREGRDLELLTSAFGNLRFVYLRRLDTLAQAVSWCRAEQTDVWHKTDRSDRSEQKQDPRYDFDRINELVRMIVEHNLAWEQWFASVGVRPHSVLYEELERGPVEVTKGVLAFLELELAAGREIVGRHQRLGDLLSAQWIDRYGTQARR
jgi:LPS sulfotransferase NodH